MKTAINLQQNDLFTSALSDLIATEIEKSELEYLEETDPRWIAAQNAAALAWDAVIAIANAHTAKAVARATKNRP